MSLQRVQKGLENVLYVLPETILCPALVTLSAGLGGQGVPPTVHAVHLGHSQIRGDLGDQEGFQEIRRDSRRSGGILGDQEGF